MSKQSFINFLTNVWSPMNTNQFPVLINIPTLFADAEKQADWENDCMLFHMVFMDVGLYLIRTAHSYDRQYESMVPNAGSPDHTVSTRVFQQRMRVLEEFRDRTFRNIRLILSQETYEKNSEARLRPFTHELIRLFVTILGGIVSIRDKMDASLSTRGGCNRNGSSLPALPIRDLSTVQVNAMKHMWLLPMPSMESFNAYKEHIRAVFNLRGEVWNIFYNGCRILHFHAYARMIPQAECETVCRDLYQTHVAHLLHNCLGIMNMDHTNAALATLKRNLREHIRNYDNGLKQQLLAVFNTTYMLSGAPVVTTLATPTPTVAPQATFVQHLNMVATSMHQLRGFTPAITAPAVAAVRGPLSFDLRTYVAPISNTVAPHAVTTLSVAAPAVTVAAPAVTVAAPAVAAPTVLESVTLEPEMLDSNSDDLEVSPFVSAPEMPINQVEEPTMSPRDDNKKRSHEESKDDFEVVVESETEGVEERAKKQKPNPTRRTSGSHDATYRSGSRGTNQPQTAPRRSHRFATRNSSPDQDKNRNESPELFLLAEVASRQ
jgi:hypothetical protein